MAKFKRQSSVVRRAGIFVAGITVIIAGVLLLVLPGPGLLVMAAGLAILAIEFEWAKKHHVRLKKAIRKSVKKIRKL